MFKKISLIGAGNIGGTLAYLIMQRQLAKKCVLFDINVGAAKGKALDISQASSVEMSDTILTGSNDYSDISDSDVVVVTAGVPRKPGMSRDDLLEINAKVMREVGEAIHKYCPDSFIICVTNPLDVMVGLLQHYAKALDHRIVGMAGILDSSRFRSFLAAEFKVSIKQVQAYVLGGHGDTMVPLIRHTTVAGQSLEELVKTNKISLEKLESIIQRTRDGGAEIVNLLGNGSAYYAPAASVLSMIEAHLYDKNSVFPCAVKITGQYGIKESLFVGVPVKISAKGISEIIELPLNDSEKKQFLNSVAAVKDLNSAVAKLNII